MPVRFASSVPTASRSASSPCPRPGRWPASSSLDLVEVADKANPPVCRIMDYGKYKYEAAQRAKESRTQEHQRRRQGDEVPAQDRARRTSTPRPARSSSSSAKVTRSRSRSCSVVARCSTPSWASASSTTWRTQVDRHRTSRGLPQARRSQHDHGPGPDKKAQAAKAAERKRDKEEAEAAAPAADGPPRPHRTSDHRDHRSRARRQPGHRRRGPTETAETPRGRLTSATPATAPERAGPEARRSRSATQPRPPTRRHGPTKEQTPCPR